ncbi:cobalamin biosynthesis protein CobY [Sphingomonas sp. Leaf357]|uniref:NTP transferase domain-containing protein n=1 Tax=Sphingomonas sp. Leaf357 TaxID=1736350 RepID=UPI0006F91A16|nr:NTP transferase domain-containing protein [Sphingomonas sp. Leaf357]KQS04806.1 cobalamin biosynthesis protein CobY [Sphingomonas sp. Leaf357]
MSRSDDRRKSFNALILAGSRGGVDPVAEYAGVGDKAMIEIGGRTMLARVADAVRGAGAVRIVVVASAPVVRRHAEDLGLEVIDAAAGPSASAGRGFDLLGAPLLVTTADHALLESDWVNRFVADVPGDADVAVLLARRDTIEQAVPETRRTYLRFADGAWSGCNLFYLATPRAASAITLWQSVESDRKRPWRIVRRLGPTLLLRYLLGRLTLAAGLAQIGKLAGVRAAMVPSPFGLAAVDVDKPADLDLVRRLVGDAR